ncbi:MAG: hypothetical protein PHQ96_09455 [Candidatus Omnitrophica bacterium]|nr:hypothetical protein [Candidatus Omnitrophota bacterium]
MIKTRTTIDFIHHTPKTRKKLSIPANPTDSIPNASGFCFTKHTTKPSSCNGAPAPVKYQKDPKKNWVQQGQ